jgi:hypothetical protein
MTPNSSNERPPRNEVRREPNTARSAAEFGAPVDALDIRHRSHTKHESPKRFMERAKVAIPHAASPSAMPSSCYCGQHTLHGVGLQP